MTASKWQERFKKQVQANNLLSDKLRDTRKRGQGMITTLQQAYQEKVSEVLTLKLKIQTLELALAADGLATEKFAQHSLREQDNED